MIPHDLHDCHLLVHQLKVLLAGHSADDLDRHRFVRFQVPAPHNVCVRPAAEEKASQFRGENSKFLFLKEDLMALKLSSALDLL